MEYLSSTRAAEREAEDRTRASQSKEVRNGKKGEKEKTQGKITETQGKTMEGNE